MFKMYAFSIGTLSLVAAFASTGFEFVSVILLLVGVIGYFACRFVGMELDSNPPLFCMLAGSIGIGIMPMDGSWMLLGLTMIAALSGAACLGHRLHMRLGLCGSDDQSGQPYLIFGLMLPIIGLGLFQYIGHTGGNPWTGLLLLGGLSFLGYKVTPSSKDEAPQPHLRLAAND